MTDLIGDLIKTALGGLIGSGVAYLIWIRQKVLELRHSHDTWLRDARYAAYKRLWKALQLLALHSPPDDVTEEGLLKFGQRLRQLYFSEGLLLTNRSRDVFLLLQECIGLFLAANPSGAERVPLRRQTAPVSAQDLKALRARFPKLEPARLESPHLFSEWLEATTKQARGWRFEFEAPEPGHTHPTFLLLQYLASSLRTVMSADLNSRDMPLLQPSSGLE